MSFGAIGVGIGVAGLGLSAYQAFSSSSGGGAKLDSKSIKQALSDYQAKVGQLASQ